MWTYKGFVIKRYAVIHNGYKYSILESDGFTHVASARSQKEMRGKVNEILGQRNS